MEYIQAKGVQTACRTVQRALCNHTLDLLDLSCNISLIPVQIFNTKCELKKYLFSCPSALAAEKDGTPVFKFPKWRAKGKPIQEVVAAYKSVGAELNVLPFCTQFIPMDVIDCPKHGSIIYHPSILPRHRGASAINW